MEAALFLFQGASETLSRAMGGGRVSRTGAEGERAMGGGASRQRGKEISAS